MFKNIVHMCKMLDIYNTNTKIRKCMTYNEYKARKHMIGEVMYGESEYLEYLKNCKKLNDTKKQDKP